MPTKDYLCRFLHKAGAIQCGFIYDVRLINAHIQHNGLVLAESHRVKAFADLCIPLHMWILNDLQHCIIIREI